MAVVSKKKQNKKILAAGGSNLSINYAITGNKMKVTVTNGVSNASVSYGVVDTTEYVYNENDLV